jgi:hypothetical protein
MKNSVLNLTTLILITVTFGCGNQFYCSRCVNSLKDSTNYVEIDKVRLDTIYLKTKADTVIIKIPVDSAINAVYDSKRQRTQIVYQDKKIYIQNICKEDSLMGVIQGKDKVIQQYISRTQQVTSPSFFNTYKIYFVIGFIVFIILLLLSLVRRFIIS